MKDGIFVTGTGTDVGKTYISGLLVKGLRESGVNAGYFKPALSGAQRISSHLIPGDAAAVTRIGRLPGDPAKRTGYCFEPALSPHLAARLCGRPIMLPEILHRYRQAAADYSFMVVEGCGGLFCPLQDVPHPLLLEEVIREMEIPLLLVCPSGLGAIHAAVTTAFYAASKRVPVIGIAMNGYDPNSLMHRDNRKQIQRFTNLPVLTVLKDASDIDTKLLLEWYGRSQGHR